MGKNVFNKNCWARIPNIYNQTIVITFDVLNTGLLAYIRSGRSIGGTQLGFDGGYASANASPLQTIIDPIVGCVSAA